MLANSHLLVGSSIGDLDAIAQALDMGADIETRGRADQLQHASSEDSTDGPDDGTNFEEVVVLSDHGHFHPQGEMVPLGPPRKDLQRLTPLMHAAMAGQAEAVDFLLQQGANPHAQDAEGMTSLHHAAAAGSSESCSALLRAGANRWVWDDEGRDAFACVPREAKKTSEGQAWWAKLLRPVALPGNTNPTGAPLSGVTPGTSRVDLVWKPPKQRLVP